MATVTAAAVPHPCQQPQTKQMAPARLGTPGHMCIPGKALTGLARPRAIPLECVQGRGRPRGREEGGRDAEHINHRCSPGCRLLSSYLSGLVLSIGRRRAGEGEEHSGGAQRGRRQWQRRAHDAPHTWHHHLSRVVSCIWPQTQGGGAGAETPALTPPRGPRGKREGQGSTGRAAVAVVTSPRLLRVQETTTSRACCPPRLTWPSLSRE